MNLTFECTFGCTCKIPVVSMQEQAQGKKSATQVVEALKAELPGAYVVYDECNHEIRVTDSIPVPAQLQKRITLVFHRCTS